MVEKENKHSLNVTFDQHEAIIGMKRGRDTVYDVMDRLIDTPKRLNGLESSLWQLSIAINELQTTAIDLRTEMEKWDS